MNSRILSLVPALQRAALALTVSAAALLPTIADAQPAAPAAPATPAAAPAAPAQQARPLRVYLRAGLKTHGAGEHDYPQFLADWSKILTERGAIVDGSLHFPTADELANIDVMVTYKGDAGYMTLEEKATLETFLKRGGGLVALHDTICAEDAEWFASIYGGAKKHGETNFTLAAPVAYTITDTANPIMAGMKDFTITDESFYKMTWTKIGQIKPLATAPQAGNVAKQQGVEGEVVPQIWTYERTIQGPSGGRPYRAFVWMQGHNYANLTHEQVQPMLLRAIAWAGQAPIDSILNVRAQGRGGRGGGRGGRGATPGATPSLEEIINPGVTAPAPATK